MKRYLTLLLLPCLFLSLTACGGSESGSSPAKLTPEKLAKIGAKIHENPDRAEQILRDHGLNRDEFMKKIQEISEDPKKSSRYSQAFQKHVNSK